MYNYFLIFRLLFWSPKFKAYINGKFNFNSFGSSTVIVCQLPHIWLEWRNKSSHCLFKYHYEFYILCVQLYLWYFVIKPVSPILGPWFFTLCYYNYIQCTIHGHWFYLIYPTNILTHLNAVIDIYSLSYLRLSVHNVPRLIKVNIATDIYLVFIYSFVYYNYVSITVYKLTRTVCSPDMLSFQTTDKCRWWNH